MTIVGRRSLRAGFVLMALVAGLVAPVVDTGAPAQASAARAGAWTPPPEHPDADLVVILPAVGKGAFDRQRAALQPWLDDLGLSYSLVPLSSIVRHKDLASLTAEQVRDH